MHRRPSCLRFTSVRFTSACAFSLSFVLASAAWSAGPPPNHRTPQIKPAVAAPDPGTRNTDKEAGRPLGGRLVKLDDSDDASEAPTESNRSFNKTNDAMGSQGFGTPSSPGTPFSPTSPGNASQGNTSPQAAAVLGPAPYDLGRVKSLRVTTRDIAEPPMRVGNMDVLSPLVEELPMLGASVTKADRSVIPDIAGAITENQFFQVNRPGSPPVVLQIGKASAWIDKSEQPLRAAPLIIGNQIYLPVFSIAPLIGAATRLDPQGALVLTPTVQSAELFAVSGTVAATIKTSIPVAPGSFKIVNVKGPSPKIYVDFTGYSMGFDAGNTTVERLVSNGVGQVKGVRAAQPKFFPDVTRVVLDLKEPMDATVQQLTDPRVFALVLSEPQRVAAQIPPETGDPGIPPSPTQSGQPKGAPIPNGGTLKGWKIVIDAGHGDYDTGAQGTRSLEKNHTLDIATRLANQLRVRGATVLMTRATDVFIPLAGRSDFANTRGANLFISVHINASPNRGSQGTETFFYSGQSRPLANVIHREFIKATGRPNRGVSQARFWVIRKTWMPSVLLECAFITNSQEETLLMNPAWRERVAQGIARGVNNYANIYPLRSAG